MTPVRKIIHLDLDAFFCAVEEQRDPSLRGLPFAVGGRPEGRGVVASCSYPARRFGVRSAMPMGQALRLCPTLRIVDSHHRDYSRVSRQVMATLRRMTDRVEQLSIDEAFLDVSDLAQPAVELARRLQATIRTEVQLPSSLGVATNKLVAKIANNVGKAAAGGHGPPNAIQVVPPGQEATFLAPLPCEELWGVGPKTAEKLHLLGLHTIGDIAAWPQEDMARRFGKQGRALAAHARGLDERPVVTHREAKSISQETTFARDVSDKDKLAGVMRRQAESVAARLRGKSFVAGTVKIKLRWPDFSTPTRQVTLEQPTDDADRIYAAALQLFERLWAQRREPVRLIGVGVDGLSHQPRQLSLWDVGSEELVRVEELYRKESALADVLQTLGERFGEGAVRRGSELTEDDEDRG